MSKLDLQSGVRINTYEVISRAVEEGVTYGFNRAFKHTDAPSNEGIKDEIERAVLNALCEVLDFSYPEEEE